MTSANQTPRIITITTPGPQGIQGPPGFASSGSNTYLGDQIITGSILISGSIVPDVGIGETTSSFSLGSETAAWKDIYVSEGSIKFIKSGSSTVTLSAANGGISVDGGSVISADGVSGQFITSKSLDTDITVKDYNNSLLMGPIDIETDKEIIIEEGSDLTIFGDIEIQNVSTADTALFATSASFSNSSSYANSSSYSDTTSYASSASFSNTSSYATSASFSNTSSYAATASYVLNSTSTSFPFSGSAVITGSLIINDGNYDIFDTTQWSLKDTSGGNSVDWNNRVLYANDGSTSHIDWNDPSYISLPSITENTIVNVLGIDGNGRLYYTASNALGGGESNTPTFPYTGSAIISGSLVVTGSIASTSGFTGSVFGTTTTASYLNIGTGQIFDSQPGQTIFQAARIVLTASNIITLSSPNGVTFNNSATFNTTTKIADVNTSGGIFIVDPIITPPTHPGANGQILPFQSGSIYRIYVYLAGAWRSASLS